MKNKRFVCILVCCMVTACAGLFAQQITKFGVVDTARVYESYFRETGPVRNYEAKRTEFQVEINKQTEALRDLQSKKVDYRKNGNEAAALRLEAEITAKTDILNEYTNAKNIELESLKRSLKTSDDFYRRLYSTLERIAEAGGYSMILSLQESNAILWFSPTVDITDEVISALGL